MTSHDFEELVWGGRVHIYTVHVHEIKNTAIHPKESSLVNYRKNTELP